MELKDNLIGLEHVGVPTKDLAKTIAFYESLGFTVALRTAVPAAEKCGLFAAGQCDDRDLRKRRCGRQARAIDHLALKARDIEAAFKAVKALGYEMVNDEIEFLPFWENGVRFFTFYGPNREKIEFSQIQ